MEGRLQWGEGCQGTVGPLLKMGLKLKKGSEEGEREIQSELKRSLRRDSNVEHDPQILALGGLKQLTNYPNR